MGHERGQRHLRYDPFGRRTSKTVNGTTTVWLRDEQGHAVAEYDGASGALVHYPLHGAGTAPVARIGADSVTAVYYDTDRLGNYSPGLMAGAYRLGGRCRNRLTW